MVRTLHSSHNHNHQLPDDDYDDVINDISTIPATHTSFLPELKYSEEAKASHSRSKHSVTEQRRRSKINERFQILRDLIPPNDQKRDKASLLLEVIEYIQFLQEKIQIYEGPYQQVPVQEPTKLIPWRADHGPVETSANDSQIMKNGSMGDIIAVHPLANVAEPDYNVEYAYRRADYPAGSSNATASLNTPFQSFGNAPAEELASVPHEWFINECAVIGNEDRTYESGSNSLSSVYSQGLLKKLTESLQTSGMDMSHASISVQLDIGKRASNISSISASLPEDAGRQSARPPHGLYEGEVSGRGFGASAKKHRMGES